MQKLLLVDDQHVDLLVVSSWLQSEGINVLTHDSPLGMLSLVLREAPDVLMVDVEMPDLSGPALLEILRKTLGRKVPPVIFYSGASGPLGRIVCMPPVLGCMRKTSDSEAFLAEFRQLMGTMRRHCYRALCTPRHPASVAVSLETAAPAAGRGGEDRFAVENLSIATREQSGGMLLRAEGPMAGPWAEALKAGPLIFPAWIHLSTAPTPIEARIKVVRVVALPLGARLGVEYIPVEAEQDDRFRRYWLQCQHDLAEETN